MRVRVTPRARAARIDGLQGEADGGVRLRVAVTEAEPRLEHEGFRLAADAGRANAALLALLAKAWRLPRGTLSITSGVADRRKTVSIAGDSGSLMDRLLRWSQTEGWRAGE